MIQLNGKKFAENDAEFKESLFHKGGTCVGYYKVFKKQVQLLNMQKEKVGVITNNVLGKATRQENGKYWYSYGDVDIVGEYASDGNKRNEVEAVMNLLNV